MSCPCKNKNKVQALPPVEAAKPVETVNAEVSKSDLVQDIVLEQKPLAAAENKGINTVVKTGDVVPGLTQENVVINALKNNLEQCYLCSKKHLMRAQIMFEEYHTGYPDHIKNLVDSLRASESDVMKAFVLWQQVMGHLDQSANELLGKDANAETMNAEHIEVAKRIRSERLKLAENPLAVPDFITLLLSIHELQHKYVD